MKPYLRWLSNITKLVIPSTALGLFGGLVHCIGSTPEESRTENVQSKLWGTSWVNPGWGTPPPLVGKPSISSWSSQQMQIWARGVDGHIKTVSTSNGGVSWGPWHNFQLPSGFTAIGDPVAVSRAKDCIDIVVNGSDGNIWYNRWVTNNWIGWQIIPNSFGIGAVALNSWSKERLDLWAISASGTQIVHNVLVQSADSTASPIWSGWPAGGTLSTPAGIIDGITAISRGHGLIDRGFRVTGSFVPFS